MFKKLIIRFILFSVKSIYNHLPETLSYMSSADLKTLPYEIENCHLVYIPEIGFVIAVIKWKIPVMQQYYIKSLEYKFSIGKTKYYKSFLTKGKSLYYLQK